MLQFIGWQSVGHDLATEQQLLWKAFWPCRPPKRILEIPIGLQTTFWEPPLQVNFNDECWCKNLNETLVTEPSSTLKDECPSGIQNYRNIKSARILCPWDSPGKNTGVDCHFISRRTSQSRDQTQVSCFAGQLFTIRATREALRKSINIDLMYS